MGVRGSNMRQRCLLALMPRRFSHSLLPVIYLLLYYTATGSVELQPRFQRWVAGGDVSARAVSQCPGRNECYWYSYMIDRSGRAIISETATFTTNQIGEYIWQVVTNGALVEVLVIYKVTSKK